MHDVHSPASPYTRTSPNQFAAGLQAIQKYAASGQYVNAAKYFPEWSASRCHAAPEFAGQWNNADSVITGFETADCALNKYLPAADRYGVKRRQYAVQTNIILYL